MASETVDRVGPSQKKWLGASVSTSRARGMVRMRSSAWTKATPPSLREAVTRVGQRTDRRVSLRYRDLFGVPCRRSVANPEPKSMVAKVARADARSAGVHVSHHDSTDTADNRDIN